MKERPILFSGPMVRAIIDGRKTQTRRMVKPQPVLVGEPSVPFRTADADPKGIIPCPYGAVGGRLWVRETWGLMSYHDTTDWCGGSIKAVPECELRERYLVEHAANWKLPSESACWRHPVSMPRWASRITLEIVSIRVERVQEISEEDAKKEGVTITEYYAMSRHPYRSAFIDLWTSIHGGNWDANPYVWVVEFRRVEK